MVSKLEAFTRLSADDRAALQSVARNFHFVDARRDLVSEGDEPRYVHLVLDGWACRYKQLPDGKRQIVALFVPGDFCDVNVYILRQMDHSIGAITRLKVATITPEEMNALTAERPRITQALWWHELVAAAVQREWTLNLGQRSAYERLAHMLLELYLRLEAVGRARDGRCDFPLTQNDLADATGLTAVHVNRMLQKLRRDGLIELERKQLQILDIPRMMDASKFKPNYLHLDHEGRYLDANA
ncbi:Crp/Fnr family transcriptional regulator [Sphingomonas agri]|uniref:Crp/Fnr family transcriptional regulator n=1 Tax=Sphingomonas agri TaxID=1813878 RepID=UPI00311E88EB